MALHPSYQGARPNPNIMSKLDHYPNAGSGSISGFALERGITLT
jgi:hypothetical protein